MFGISCAKLQPIINKYLPSIGIACYSSGKVKYTRVLNPLAWIDKEKFKYTSEAVIEYRLGFTRKDKSNE